MSLVLMCKDAPVLNIKTQQVYSHSLLPGMLLKCQDRFQFMDWFQKRYSEPSNTMSRQFISAVFDHGNRDIIDKTTHALSLSDCYWIKDEDESISFKDISPYYNNFWSGNGQYNGEAVPTLYVNGYLTKYWESKAELIKKDCRQELLCVKLAKALGITSAYIREHEYGIAVSNFTSDTIMFESAEASGRIRAEDFTTGDVLRLFDVGGFDMLFLDALIGNGDRHAGNFGFLRNADTGEYIGMAPLFDYDHAYDSRKNNDSMIKELKKYKNNYESRFNELVNKSKALEILDDYMKDRLNSITLEV